MDQLTTERRLSAVEVQVAEVRTDLRNHLIICERRSGVIQKLCFWILGGVSGAILLLIKLILSAQLKVSW